MHLSSNGATANVLHYDLDLHIQVHEFVNCDHHDTSADLANGYRESQNCNGSSIRFASDNKGYIFSPQILLPFQLLQMEWKTHIVSFLANCSTNSGFFCGL